ncbi:hypothetical protein ACJ41O_003458 [Fusarium nematophilum]
MQGSRIPQYLDEPKEKWPRLVEKYKLDESNLPGTEDMISMCGGLVTVDENNVLRLVHYTTQEYLTRTRETWFPGVERSMAMACIAYLSFDAFSTGVCLTAGDVKQRQQQHPFYHQAARNWGITPVWQGLQGTKSSS